MMHLGPELRYSAILNRCRQNYKTLMGVVLLHPKPRKRISPVQQRAVRLLKRRGGVTVKELADCLNVKAGSARAILTRLRKDGYQIQRSLRDGRGSIYHIRRFGRLR